MSGVGHINWRQGPRTGKMALLSQWIRRGIKGGSLNHRWLDLVVMERNLRVP